MSSRWLRAHGYSNSLVARYVASGWLVSPARGVYLRKGGRLQWEGVVRSLQLGEGLPLHLGGRFALTLQGHEHYLRLGDAGTVTLYGRDRPPGWVDKLSMAQRFEYLGKGPLDLPAVPFTHDMSEAALSAQGLAWYRAGPSTDALVCSSPERAMLGTVRRRIGCRRGLRGRCAHAGHDHAAAAAGRFAVAALPQHQGHTAVPGPG
ncbi:MAG TPA: AbiEi antitoxin N-terminal domain-containing protein [Pseudomonas sp.]|nr:AbiEi antitoxin N-terminal domain-containing protein [Pseudomonas sp.]